MSNVKLYSFTGSHYEIGFQQGKTLKNIIAQIDQNIPNLNIVKTLKPKLVPKSFFLSQLKKRCQLLKKELSNLYPDQFERITGISDGSNIDLSSVILMNAAEIMITVSESAYSLDACTSIGIYPNKNVNNEFLIAKNFDYINEFKSYNSTFKIKPKNRFEVIGSSIVPLSGILDGMNEHGLTIVYNLANTVDIPRNVIPLSIILQETLENFKTTDDAIDFISNSKRAGNAIIMIADKNEDIKTLELSPNHSAVYSSDENYVINTNHFQTNKMKKIEIPQNAVYTKKAPKPLIGIRIHKSSEQRYNRAKELIEKEEKINEKILVSILSDHGKDNTPSMFTICRHDSHACTSRSILFYPNRKKIKVLYGNPCQNIFQEFSL